MSPAELISQNPAVADALRSHFAASPLDAAASGRNRRGRRNAVRPPCQPGDRSTPEARGRAATLPEQFGRYRMVRTLGRGGMGDVYLAEDTQADRPVALKVPRFADDYDGELIERFYREARATATVRHPNLCPVYDAGEIDGIHYLSMAYIEGRPLFGRSGRKRPAPPTRCGHAGAEARQGIDAAHKSGVIHRDLKPANIMINAHEEPILMDFGLAQRRNSEDSRLTQSGLVMGSPAYMSPEQVEGDIEKVGPACDICAGDYFLRAADRRGPLPRLDCVGARTDRHRLRQAALGRRAENRPRPRGDLPQDDRQEAGGSLCHDARRGAGARSTTGRPADRRGSSGTLRLTR